MKRFIFYFLFFIIYYLGNFQFKWRKQLSNLNMHFQIQENTVINYNIQWVAS